MLPNIRLHPAGHLCQELDGDTQFDGLGDNSSKERERLRKPRVRREGDEDALPEYFRPDRPTCPSEKFVEIDLDGISLGLETLLQPNAVPAQCAGRKPHLQVTVFAMIGASDVKPGSNFAILSGLPCRQVDGIATTDRFQSTLP